MATIMSHALAAGFFYKIFPTKKSSRVLRLCLLGSIIPDFDIIAFRFGISYSMYVCTDITGMLMSINIA